MPENDIIIPWLKTKAVDQKKSLAYYRHSAQDRQENSVEIQQDQVRKFAQEHNITIIREFYDRGISGLSVEGRDGFNEMFHDYVEGNKEAFDFILVLDVSRWGRFQETDLSAYYTGLCAKHGKQVVFTSIGFPKNDDLIHGLHLSIERYRSAQYSRELSGKVWKGQQKITSQGFWGGGMPPYAMKRLLLDEQRNPVRALEAGEHKAIHNQRVTLTLGDPKEVEAVRIIFNLFTHDGKHPDEIAVELNCGNIPSPGGASWSRSSVFAILRNEIYKGVNVWNKTSQRLQSRTKHNPYEEWIRIPDSFEPIVPPEIFDLAQGIIHAKETERLKKYSDEYMLEKLKSVYEQYGMVSRKLISAFKDMASPERYASRYHSVDLAYQAMFRNIIEKARSQVVDVLTNGEIKVVPFEDIFVIENLFTLNIQPAVAMQSGYEAYWVFHPHLRKEVDLLVGVPLAAPDDCNAMGYLFFPRMFFNRRVRIHTTMKYELSMYSRLPAEYMKELRR